MPKKYTLKEKISKEAEKELEKYDSITKQLLCNRGIKTGEEAESFLNPDFVAHLHDPFLLPGMERAVERILFAIENNEKIGIWSDYDADGIPGGALLHDFFKLIGFSNFVNYIPDRHEEGYGLNSDGVEELAKEGVKLMITIDCGIRDIEEIRHAKSLGIETIITDHHEPIFLSDENREIVPESFAIVNHKMADSKYPESFLCGSGIVWKLIEAILIKKRDLLKEGQEKWLLDLAGIATLSDMVPLRGENRALAYYGLQVLRKTRRPGLKKLYQVLKINSKNLNEDDIGFLITPRINAASRMGKPRDAFDLLVCDNEAEAEALAKHLEKLNNERKGVVASIVKEIKHTLKNRFENEGPKQVIVIGNVDWRPSLLGLAANSISEEYNRPVFIWGRESGTIIKGSCRSDGTTDLVSLMERTKMSFLEFGGHKLSGGFSISEERIHNLENDLVEASLHIVAGEVEEFADLELKIGDVNLSTAEKINKLAPFGVGNEKPVFTFYNVIPERIERFGKSKDHLLITLRDGGKTIKAISFFSNPDSWGDCLKEGVPVNLAASIELSYWRGDRPEVRLRIVDFFS